MRLLLVQCLLRIKGRCCHGRNTTLRRACFFHEEVLVLRIADDEPALPLRVRDNELEPGDRGIDRDERDRLW